MNRTITTAEELDSLPVGSVVLGDDGYPWQREYKAFALTPTWHTVRSHGDYEATAGGLLPATLIYRPDAPAPAPADDEREALAQVVHERVFGYDDFGVANEDERGEMLEHADAILAAGFTRSPQPAPVYDHPDCCDHAAAMENGHCSDCLDTGHPHAPDWPAPTVSAEQVGHFLSEWLDDYAPLNEQRYVRTANALSRRYPSLGIEVKP